MNNSLGVGSLGFNTSPVEVMHIDLNSCFATIEQQANPLLRGKPVAVAAYASPGGCILASSVEAKKCGVKTGMRVREGKEKIPSLIVLPPDPWKYRNVHISLRKIISSYTNDFHPKSIDEFVLSLGDFLSLQPLKTGSYKVVAQSQEQDHLLPIFKVGTEIKKRIKNEIGEWITVSIGISTNRFLAKLASNLKKPDGLESINSSNFLEIYSNLELTDLCGISYRNAIRLNSVGIYNVVDFYNSDVGKLKIAFNSILGYYWYLRLRGWEIDDFSSSRKTFGNSYALPKPLSKPHEIAPILTKLTFKMTARLRSSGYRAKGVHLAIRYRDGSFWHKGINGEKNLFDTKDFYKRLYKLFLTSNCDKQIREVHVSCFDLTKNPADQLDLFEDTLLKKKLVKAVDGVNERWGDYVVAPARMLEASDNVPDRIAFGNVRELEEFVNK